MRRRLVVLLASALCVLAQVPATTSVLGTVTRVRGESLEIEVKPDNAPGILALELVDGALIGGASLQASDFMAIADAV